MSRVLSSFLYSVGLVGAATVAYVGFDAWLSVTGRKTGPSVAERVIQKAPLAAQTVQATPRPTNPEIISLVRNLRAADAEMAHSTSGTTRVNPRAALVATADGMTKPIRSWPTGKNRVALTYDDGPHATVTPRLLELLKSKNVRATFFILGPKLQAHPEIGQDLVDAGMEIANHSMTHPTLPRKSEAAIRTELEGTNAVIANVLGRTTTLMRPPYGATNQKLEQICQEMGLKIVNWNIDTDDWRPNMTEERMKERIKTGLSDGSIILMHDRTDKVINVTAWAIDEIRRQGFELVTVSELLGTKPQQPIVRNDIAADTVETTPTTTAAQPTPAPAAPTPAPATARPNPTQSPSPDSPVQPVATTPAVAASVANRPVARTPSAIRIEDASNGPQSAPSVMDLPQSAVPVATPVPPAPSPLAGDLPADVLTPLPPSRP